MTHTLKHIWFHAGQAAGIVAMLLVGACIPSSDGVSAPPAPTETARITVTSGVPTALARDWDGDGIDDLLVGDSKGGSFPRTEAGDVYLIQGPVSSLELPAVTPALVLHGQEAYRHEGTNLSSCDMDGDGVRDFIIQADTSATGTEGIRAVSGTLRGEHDIDDVAFLTIEGPATLGQTMFRMDYDLDGADDLVLACPMRSAIYVVRGPRSGEVHLPDDADAVISTATGSFGSSIAPGDFDRDGVYDLAVVEPIENVLYVVPTGLMGNQDAAQIATAVIRAEDSNLWIRGVDAIRVAGKPDALLVQTRLLDSEQSGTLFLLEGPVQGELGLEESSCLTLTDAAVTYGVAATVGESTGNGIPLIALSSPATLHLPDSNLGGEVWLFDAAARGQYVLDAAGLSCGSAQITGPATSVDLLGYSLQFAYTSRSDQQDLIVAGSGAVLVFSWPSP